MAPNGFPWVLMDHTGYFHLEGEYGRKVPSLPTTATTVMMIIFSGLSDRRSLNVDRVGEPCLSKLQGVVTHCNQSYCS